MCCSFFEIVERPKADIAFREKLINKGLSCSKGVQRYPLEKQEKAWELFLSKE